MHCGRRFTITADQLGGEGVCPRCGEVIHLPEADDPATLNAYHQEHDAVVRRKQWFSNSISALASCVIHMLLIILLAVVSYGGSGLPGDEGEEVLLGQLPSEQLTQTQEESLDTAEVIKQTSQAEQFDEALEVEPPVNAAASQATSDISISSLSPSGGGSDSGGFDLGAVSVGGGGGEGGWDGMIQSLRRNGLDVVITFDSTGSMAGEIQQVKEQISRIGSTLLKLVPKTRLSICTYRDMGDEYQVKGLPLTSDLSEVQYYLNSISAGGGGDHPEAVDLGLQWAMNNNQFRPQARKVILVFGDAPPHRNKLTFCLALASDFSRQNKGIVSTVTCRSRERLPEFYEIAQAGGGEAFLTTDERQIMAQLIILVFGSRHRDKVLEAFKLLEH